MRGRLVAGNWKSNGDLAANQLLLGHLRAAAAGLQGVDCVVCAPYPYLFQIQQLLAGSTLTWGGQDVSQFGAGAYTGAVTAAMLREFGCRYAIVGHSERRSIFGENNAMVAAKFGAALQAGLTPILCVGETLQERESGAMEQVVGAQIDAVVTAAGVAALGKAVVAYEPVWAIGTGKTATPEQAQAAHAFIRSRIAAQDAVVAAELKILYGGSVKAANAAQLFAMPDIDGGLIGGAALVAEEFMAICKAAQRH
ncbi:MAG: triose-phosphate isomerase [Betaproteobacteria bacterium]|nr:triose-phosphate isomerase [Betaproteobacteria bacterium]